MMISCTNTSREAREEKVNWQPYYFVSEDEFERMKREDELLEWAEFVGRQYGTPRRYIEDKVAEGKTVIMDIDIQGAAQIRAAMPEAVSVFLVPPSFKELNRRIHDRGLDSEAAIERRLTSAHDEMQAVTEYDYAIVNDDLHKAAAQLQAIITAENCRVSRSDWPRAVAAIGKGEDVL